MDILYPLKEIDNNFELRYSLRSLKNLPHDRVFVCGYKPRWMTDDVIEIPVPQNPHETKYLRSVKNLMAAMKDERLSEDFILMNDDFFVMLPVKEVPVLHRGPLNDMVNYYHSRFSNSPYTAGLIKTFHKLDQMGIDDALSYEVHAPMVFNKKKFLEVLEMSLEMDGFGKRTLYGNINKLGGELIQDVKFTNPRRAILDDMPFVSTDEGSFLYHQIGGYIRGRFTERSQYEQDLPWVKPITGVAE